MKSIKQFLRSVRGVSSVEFALTVPFFILLLSMVFELARISLLSAYLDFALSEASREAKNRYLGSGDYQRIFEQKLKDEKIWRFLNAGGTFQIQTDYADDLRALLQNRYREPTFDKDGKPVAPIGSNAGLARYSFTYTHNSWIPLVPQEWFTPIFQRQIVVVQEYERSLFPFVSDGLL
ncbi:TadE/TadG family type IV pilus assembly protein [Testudinibacter sp. P80/BLE/0925]|uniref:TadE/TadG family type IV pilus assembly protein n=1 Tax=Testudinibacter sp. TW-1 TaxID=3417757 RepID=UPI003D35E764